METIIQDNLTKRRKGYIRTGKVKVMPIKRSSDWLSENADSLFMNTGAKVEYVTPRLQRSGTLVDPLADLTEDQKLIVAKQLGFKDTDGLNVMKKEKENFWINRAVSLDKNGIFLDLSSISDFINYKILEVNGESIAPSWEERYNKGTFKFALVFEEEESKMKNLKIDTKKEAYILFGKIDGSVKKLSDVLWIHYLTNKEGKRLPLNPTLEYLRGEVGRIIEERPGEFMSIVSDTNFETKALIQKAINLGLIQRDGQMFRIFGEDTSKNTLDGLIDFLLDERNNNIRISLIGKIEANDSEGKIIKPTKEDKEEVNVELKVDDKINKLEEMIKASIEENNRLKELNQELLSKLDKPIRKKKNEE